MAETRIIKAVFGASKSIVASPRYRYDYGQVIEVSGVTLPEFFEARFSNSESGASIRVLGSNQQVAIPDECLLNTGYVWCYITVHDEATDGRTMYSIRIPIKEATERTDAEPTPVQQDIITQAISALNVAQDEWNNMSATAETLNPDDPAQASYSDGVLTLGIPRGQRGEQGEKGDKGDTGAQGIQGVKGDKGDTGDTGPQGETGPQGPKGDTGETGATGPKGNKGDKGDKGDTGEKGDKGDPGEVTLADFYKAFATDTATGTIASFPDGADDIPMKDVLVHIEPVQEGSGDPSPDNVRPITGWTGAKVSHSGADTSNPTIYPITFPSEAGTVYGGTLDVSSGELVVDRAMVDLGTLSWAYLSGDNRFRSNVAKMANKTGRTVKMVCDCYKALTNGEAYNPNQDKVCYGAYGSLYVHDFTYGTDAYAFKTAVTGQKLVYELASSITYPITPHEIRSLLGDNNVWGDTGDTAVTYKADIQRYIAKKLG